MLMVPSLTRVGVGRIFVVLSSAFFGVVQRVSLSSPGFESHIDRLGFGSSLYPCPLFPRPSALFLGILLLVFSVSLP